MCDRTDILRTSRSTSPLPFEPTSPVINAEISMTTPLYGDNSLDHINYLERTVCSNYLCCGGQLPDLHALLDHFEEDHVVALAPNGMRVYPRDGLRTMPLHRVESAFTTPASSRSSSVTPSSPSETSSGPSSPMGFTLPTLGPLATVTRKSSIAATPVIYTPFTPSLPVDPTDPYPYAEQIVMAHEPLYDFPPDAFPAFSYASTSTMVGANCLITSSSSSVASSSDEDEDYTMSNSDMDISDSDTPQPTSPLLTYIHRMDKTPPVTTIPKHVKPSGVTPTSRHSARPSASSFVSSSLALEGMSNTVKALSTTPMIASVSALPGPSSLSSKLKARKRYPSTGPTSSRKREKLYRCPTPRCTKTYLNPNGLKYHMEKGTCKIEKSSFQAQPEDPSESSPSSPLRSPPSFTSYPHLVPLQPRHYPGSYPGASSPSTMSVHPATPTQNENPAANMPVGASDSDTETLAPGPNLIHMPHRINVFPLIPSDSVQLNSVPGSPHCNSNAGFQDPSQAPQPQDSSHIQPPPPPPPQQQHTAPIYYPVPSYPHPGPPNPLSGVYFAVSTPASTPATLCPGDADKKIQEQQQQHHTHVSFSPAPTSSGLQ